MVSRHLGCIAATLLLSVAWAGPARAADPLHDARKRVAEARAAVTKASVGVKLEQRKLVKQMESTPEWTKAAAAAREAGAKYTAAANAVRKKLASQPQYKAAVTQRSRRQGELDALKAAKDTPREKLTTAAVALLNADSAVSQLEHAALEADPDVTSAKADRDEANAKLAALRKEFFDRAKDDPAYQAAQQKLDQANADYAEASKQLVAMKKQQEADEERRTSQDIETARQQLQDNSGFRR